MATALRPKSANAQPEQLGASLEICIMCATPYLSDEQRITSLEASGEDVFNILITSKNQIMAVQSTLPAGLQFPKPKILVVDCDESVTKLLVKAGFNAKQGRFGTPYSVECDDRYTPVIGDAVLPNYSEQEIVVVDLIPPERARSPKKNKTTSYGTPDWWARMNRGYVDPRPRAMLDVHDVFDRLFEVGGIFVVFCEPRETQDIFFGAGNEHGRLHRSAQALENDNWSFLSILRDKFIKTRPEQGVEVQLQSADLPLTVCLGQHLKNSRFSTTLHPEFYLSETSSGPTFFPLLTNKHGDSVGGVIIEPKNKGLVLLLPHFADKATLIHDLMMTALPDIRPQWFPFSGRKEWLHDEAYEHPRVLNLVARQRQVVERARQEVATIEKEIAVERERLNYLHGVLTETGDDLVAYVKQSLEMLGFFKVIDSDAENDQERKQEDLQIDESGFPLVLVEVKGLNGLPKESDTLQVVKYIPRRMKEYHRPDVTGLCVVNHQRSVPPLKRANDKVFTPQQLEDAEHQEIVLISTWELFRLLRGKIDFNWPFEVVRGVFFGSGKANLIPSHWQPVGRVAHFYNEPQVASILLENTLTVGDSVAYFLDRAYVEEPVSSLQLNNNSITRGESGQQVGHKTSRLRSELKDGTIVYRVKTSPRND